MGGGVRPPKPGVFKDFLIAVLKHIYCHVEKSLCLTYI